MTERARALAILRQARDILARRLTERVIEMEEELLDDARGETYCGEIDTLYDQLALRLNHVNTMLASLPPEEETTRLALPYTPARPESGSAAAGGESPSRSDGAFLQADTLPTATESLAAGLHELHEVTALPSAVTFELFARQILCDELEWAGRSLAVLFGVDEELGRHSASVFHARLGQSHEVMSQLLRLRRELQEGGIHGPLKLLEECFALEGLEALSVLQTLRARLIGHNEAA